MPKAPRGTRRDSPAAAIFFGGLPEGRYGKRVPFVYRGMGMGREGGKTFG